MKKKLITFISIFFLAITVFSQSPYDGYKQLEIEKKYGIPIEDKHFRKLDFIMNTLREKVPVKEVNDTGKAAEICRKMYKVIVKDLNINYNYTQLLSEGLDSNYLDCNFYSLVYHTFLSTIHNFNTALIQTPGHVFLRWYINKKTWINFETTSGEVLSDDYYIERFTISKQALKDKLYMVPLSPTELEACAIVELTNSFRVKDLNVRKSLCEKAFQLYPKLILALNNLVLISVEEGKIDEAMNWLNKSIVMDSLNYTTYHYAGDMYKEIENYEKAMYYYNKAIAVNDRDPSSYSRRAECYLDMGKIEQAMQDFELATTMLKKNDIFNFLLDYYRLRILEKRIMEEYLKKFEK